MTKLAFLVVDDKTEWSGALVDALRGIPDTTVQECGRADGALARARAEYFDVCFVDLLLREFDSASQVVYEGVRLIEQLRQSARSSVIVGYSASIEQGRESSNRITDECRDAGADVVLARTTLLSMASSKLAVAIHGWITTRAKTHPSDRILTAKTDIETQAAMETIGERVLQLLLEDLLPEGAADAAQALTGGFSGALVLSVTSRTRGPGSVVTENVVKVSRAEFSLESELRRRPIIGSHLERHAVSSVARTSRRIDGWRAALFREVSGAVPLARYLNEPGFTGVTQRTLDRLVTEVCTRPAREAQPLIGDAAIDGEYRLSWRAGAALVKALNDLAGMSSVVKKRDRTRAALVARYVSAILDGKASLVSGRERFARLHGDLHADNLFVANESSPVVIDFERSDVYPRLFDIACLHVDLMLVRLDHGRGRDWDLEQVDRWAAWATAAFPFKESDGERETDVSGLSQRIHYLRHALLTAMKHELELVTAHEYGRALLV